MTDVVVTQGLTKKYGLRVLGETPVSGSPRVGFVAQDTPLYCGREAEGPRACEQWLAGQGLSQKITYVPAGQFWALQWRELGLLLVTTGLLSAFCVWWIRRRVA